MKYPSHIILDITTRTVHPIEPNWEGSYARMGTLTLPETTATKNLVLLKAKSPYMHSNLVTEERGSEARFTPLSLFDIHFLRKERLYTKLKYSRCPQYDIVSGGFAALLAGFIGFLISEKFGIELVDSGDFYNAFMYAVFASFSLLPLIRIYSKNNTPYSPISLKYLYLFLSDVIVLLLRFTASKLCSSYAALKALFYAITRVIR